MSFKRSGVLVIAALLWAGSSVRAHHSFAAEYDIEKPITLKGIVTKVEWVNPHVYMSMDVKDQAGKTTTWSLSTLGPAGVRRAGITKATLLGTGDAVTVLAYHAKDSSNLAFMRRLTFADGHTVEIWLGDDKAQ